MTGDLLEQAVRVVNCQSNSLGRDSRTLVVRILDNDKIVFIKGKIKTRRFIA